MKKKPVQKVVKECMARMVLEMRGNRLWLDVTDIYQFSKRVTKLL